ncbi:MAG: hypothetical protein OEY23_05855 [Acidimicrobiia bacterium]|nr:hypothetical protein [Acidimicrobiia bacterium]
MPIDTDAVVERYWADVQAGDYGPEWMVGQLDLEAALDVQLGILGRHLESGETQAGWKVGLTSERARTMLGHDVRPYGYVLASHCFTSPAHIDAADLRHGSIEPELCLRLGADLAGPDPTRAEAEAAIAAVCAGYELNERRAASGKGDFPMMVADRLTQWGIVVGGGAPLAEIADLGAIEVTLERDGERLSHCVARDEVDDPVESLRRLCQTLHAHGQHLRAGQHVITGAFSRFDLEAGHIYRATYSGVGVVEVHT